MANYTASDITQFFQNAIGEGANQIAVFMAVIVVLAITVWVVKTAKSTTGNLI